MRSINRPAHDRRRGPDRRPVLVRWLDDALLHRRRAARRRRLQRMVAEIVHHAEPLAAPVVRWVAYALE